MGRRSRAVVLVGDSRWELRELEVPDQPVEGGGILRVEATGICRGDLDHLHGIVHTPWGGEFPTVAGHEIVGRIEQLAPGAAGAFGVNEGDRVAVLGRRTLEDGRIRVYGHDYPAEEGSGLYGGCADYMELLPGTTMLRLPDEVPAAELTVWEPLSIALRWAGPISVGDSVVIFGPGHLGLAAIVAARASGAKTVFVTGTASDGIRLEAARQLGADAIIDISADDPVARVKELTGGKGVDVVIDAAAGATSTVMQGMEVARRGGTVVIGSMKDQKPIGNFISDWIPMKNLRLVSGSEGNHMARAVELIWSGQVPTADLLGEVFPLEHIGEALDLLDRKIPGRDAIRVGLQMTEPGA